MLVPLERPDFSVRFASVEDKLYDKLLQFPKEVDRLIAQKFDGKKLVGDERNLLEEVDRYAREKQYSKAVQRVMWLYNRLKNSSLPGIIKTATERMYREISALEEAFKKEAVDVSILDKAIFRSIMEQCFGDLRGEFNNIRDALADLKRRRIKIELEDIERYYKRAAKGDEQAYQRLSEKTDPGRWYVGHFKGMAPSKRNIESWYADMTGKRVDIPEKMFAAKYKAMLDKYSPMGLGVLKEVADICNKQKAEYLRRIDNAR